MLGSTARGVDILDPQQEPPSPIARAVVRQDRRIGMAEMQPAGRARREARDERVAIAAPRLGAIPLTQNHCLCCHDDVILIGERPVRKPNGEGPCFIPI